METVEYVVLISPLVVEIIFQLKIQTLEDFKPMLQSLIHLTLLGMGIPINLS